jgi:hypothetical protein
VGEEGKKVLARITAGNPITQVEPIHLSAAAHDVSAEVQAEALRALRAMFPLSQYGEGDASEAQIDDSTSLSSAQDVSAEVQAEALRALRAMFPLSAYGEGSRR